MYAPDVPLVFLFGYDGTIVPCALGLTFLVLSAICYKTMEDALHMLLSFNITTVFCQSSIRHIWYNCFLHENKKYSNKWACSFGAVDSQSLFWHQCNVVDMNVIFTFWEYIC